MDAVYGEIADAEADYGREIDSAAREGVAWAASGIRPARRSTPFVALSPACLDLLAP